MVRYFGKTLISSRDFERPLMAIYFGKSHIPRHFLEIRAHDVEEFQGLEKALPGTEKRTQGRTGGKKGVKLG